MLEQFGQIGVFMIVGTVCVMAPLMIGSLFRPSNPYAEKLMPYECGKDPIGPAWVKFDIRFYVAALVFLIFDVEVACMYPAALAMKSVGWNGFIEIVLFVVILLFGFAYLWRRGHFDWVKSLS